MIAKQSREGWFQSRLPAGYRFGTTPALRATPPDSGGETSLSLLNSFTPSMTAHNPSVGFVVDDRAGAVTDRAYNHSVVLRTTFPPTIGDATSQHRP